MYTLMFSVARSCVGLPILVETRGNKAEQQQKEDNHTRDKIHAIGTVVAPDAESVLAVVHRHANLDSIGSAVGIAEALAAQVTIAVPSSVQSDAHPLLARAETVDGEAADPDAHELVVTFDAPSVDCVAPVGVVQTPTPLVVVDHDKSDDLATPPMPPWSTTMPAGQRRSLVDCWHRWLTD
jgi:c-di-AMP phosphodiesterase-like protein